MRTIQRALAACVLLLASLGTEAVTESDFHSATISTYHIYPYAMWVTIYDLGKTTQLDSGCVHGGEFGGVRRWKSGRYLWNALYHVRGEIRTGPNCTGPLICDSTILIKPINLDTAKARRDDPNLGPSVTLFPGKDGQCFWQAYDDSHGANDVVTQSLQKSHPVWKAWYQQRTDLENCVKDYDKAAKEARDLLATARAQGRVSGTELKAFEEADKTMVAHAALYKKDGTDLKECQALIAEAANLKKDVTRIASTADATARVSPEHITVKSGGNANFTIACSSGEPAVGFAPPAGGVGPNGGGSFTFFSDSRKPPGEHVGTIRCGYTTTTTKIRLTVTK